MRRATNEQLSSMKSTEEVRLFALGTCTQAETLRPQLFQRKHTLGERITNNPYHNEVIRSAITKNIENRYHEIHDEVVQVYSDLIQGVKVDGKEYLFFELL